jgi:hypothetical protein
MLDRALFDAKEYLTTNFGFYQENVDSPLATKDEPKRRAGSACGRAESRRLLSVRVQFEADRPNRDDHATIAGRVELAAQIADLHIDNVGVRRGLEIPNVLEKHRSGDGLAGPPHKVFKQLEFPWNQVDQPALVPDGSGD